MRGGRAGFLVPVVLVLVSSGAGAQQSPVVAPPTSPIERVQPPSQPEVAPQFQEEETPPAAVEAGPEVAVSTVSITGVTAYEADEAEAIFASLRGRTVHQGDIDVAVRALQLKYRQDGFFLTKVSASTEPDGAAVKLQVHAIEGYIASVKISGDIGPVATLVYDYLENLETIRPVRITDIERYVLLAQNVPGITIRAVLRGLKDEPGAVELVAVVERKPVDASVSDDNRGPKYAGPNEILASVALNSFTSFGDQTQFILYDTPVDDEQMFGQISTEAAIGSGGLRGRVYVGFGQTLPGDTLRALGYRSRLLTFGGDLRYPVIRTRDMSLYLDGAVDVTRSEIDLLEDPAADIFKRNSNSHLLIYRASAEFDAQDSLFGADRLGANSLEVKIHKGVGPAHPAVYAARPDAEDDFLKYTAEAKRTQHLFTWGGTSLDTLFAVTGQWTPDVLPPSEKFFLGGETYGRGFYSGEVTGDRAIAGSVELQLNDGFSTSIFDKPLEISLQYYGFYDVGQVWDRGDGAIPHHIESTGVGVRSKVTSHLSFEVEGVERFTRRPVGDDLVDLEAEHALYFRVVAQL